MESVNSFAEVSFGESYSLFYFIFLSDNQPSGLHDGNFSGKFYLVVQNVVHSVNCKALKK